MRVFQFVEVKFDFTGLSQTYCFAIEFDFSKFALTLSLTGVTESFRAVISLLVCKVYYLIKDYPLFEGIQIGKVKNIIDPPYVIDFSKASGNSPTQAESLT